MGTVSCMDGLWVRRDWTYGHFPQWLLPSACSQGARGNDGQPGPAGPPVSLFPSRQVYSRGPVESAVFAQCKRSSQCSDLYWKGGRMIFSIYFSLLISFEAVVQFSEVRCFNFTFWQVFIYFYFLILGGIGRERGGKLICFSSRI